MFRLFILFFFTTLSLFIYSKPIIHWYSQELPPFYISSGRYADKGSGDNIKNYLIKYMYDFEHKKSVVDLKRLQELAKTDPNFATYILFKTSEREKFLLFSDPYAIRFLSGLVILKENLPKFSKYINSEGKIDFEKVVLDQNIKLSFASKRFYSKSVNDVLIKYSSQKNLEEIFSQNATLANIEKLVYKRADCIVEYPSVVNYELSTNNLKADCIFLPVKGVLDFEFMYLSFPPKQYRF
jgi:uncharacterized protein (TIGR02285 family)